MKTFASTHTGDELSRADVVALQERDPFNRFELVDGELYVTPPETLVHGRATAALVGELHAYFKHHAGATVAVGVPVGHEREHMVPDVAVFLWDDVEAALWDSPAMVAEVTSKITRKRDLTAKNEAYRHAGVEEYWVLDPQARTVTIHACSSGRTILVIGEEQLSTSLFEGLRVTVSSLFS